MVSDSSLQGATTTASWLHVRSHGRQPEVPVPTLLSENASLSYHRWSWSSPEHGHIYQGKPCGGLDAEVKFE